MPDLPPDFDALRRERDEAIRKVIAEAFKAMGADPDKGHAHVSFGGGSSECYCACPDGPCEHQFSGWREFDDGLGGETFCQRCGMGAMAHDIRVAP